MYINCKVKDDNAFNSNPFAKTLVKVLFEIPKDWLLFASTAEYP